MTEIPKNNSAETGSAGAQRDFLAECGIFARRRRLGARGSAEAHRAGEQACAPERTQFDRERNLPEKSGKSGVRSRATDQNVAEKNTKPDWAVSAVKVITSLPAEALHILLADYYDETAAYIEFEQGRSRLDAEEQAFGLLLYRILRCGIDARPASLCRAEGTMHEH